MTHWCTAVCNEVANGWPKFGRYKQCRTCCQKKNASLRGTIWQKLSLEAKHQPPTCYIEWRKVVSKARKSSEKVSTRPTGGRLTGNRPFAGQKRGVVVVLVHWMLVGPTCNKSPHRYRKYQRMKGVSHNRQDVPLTGTKLQCKILMCDRWAACLYRGIIV
jgi:hypothetical protein